MNLLIWNCQGLGRPLTGCVLRDLVNQYRPQIVFVSETKNTSDYLERIRKKFDFAGACYVDPVNGAGGLMLWWTSMVSIEILAKEKHFIHTCCLRKDKQIEWIHSFVYGDPYKENREQVLNLWSSLKPPDDEAWVCSGDFNDIVNGYEKWGGRAVRGNDAWRLQQWLDSCALIDIGFKGPIYTWYNKRSGERSVAQRLDRIVGNANWRILFDSAQVIHEKLVGSDHRPLILKLDAARRRRQKDFRFEFKWVESQNWSQIMQMSWPVGPTDLNDIHKKLGLCAASLKAWHRIEVGNTREKIEELKKKIDDLHMQPMSEASKMQEELWSRELDQCWKMEEMFWLQRSRLKWLKEGDRNTRFFHATAIQRKQRNTIVKLKDEEGRWIEGEGNIRNLITCFYSNLYNCEEPSCLEEVLSCINHIVPNEVNSAIMAPISDEEIKKAVFSLGGLKAPGPDGYPGIFYQHGWSVVGNDVIKAVRNFFDSGIMPETMNRTSIVLIPKISFPTQISQYRPISLCNFLYKVISKIITTRLQPWMGQLISDSQSAFLSNRAIQDNVLIVHEMLHKLSKSKARRKFECAIKLDILKAYDRVEWGFLVEVLRRMGFADGFVNLIYQCISTVTFQILVNGELTKSFKPTRGLRQGDPLSPYLYLLVSNVLSMMLEEAIRKKMIQGVQIARRGPQLSNILFADDTILFGKATMAEISEIKLILHLYGSASGQKFNPQKSSIIFSKGTPMELRHDIKHSLGMREMSKGDTYLGLPSIWGRSKSETCYYIIDKLKQKALSWKRNLLSHGGRRVMIQAVLTAIPNYVMSCFKLPLGLCKKMNGVVSNFWWGRDEDKRGIPFISWGNLAKAKLNGGLGFRCFELFNVAMLAKQAWRLLTNPQCLWAKVIKAKYFPHTDFWNAEKGYGGSWGWHSLLVARDLLKEGVRLNLGNGRSTRIWEDPWIPDLPKFRIQTPNSNQIAPYRVCELLDNEGNWNEEWIHQRLSEEEAKAILKIPIGSLEEGDRWIWHWDRHGKFTVKTAYHKLVEKRETERLRNIPSSSARTPQEVWRGVWKLNIHQKVILFLWRAINNSISSKEQLFKRGMVESKVCDLCGLADETIEHLLFFCSHATAAWFGSKFSFRPYQCHLGSLAQWWNLLILGQTPLNQEGNSLEHIATLCWSIWKSRNDFIFKQQVPDPWWTAKRAENMCIEYTVANIQGIQSQRNSQPTSVTRWNPPPDSMVKFNIDASFNSSRGEAGLAMICRDHRGRVLDGSVMKKRARSPLAAEADALVLAMKKAIQTGTTKCIFESDCKELVQVCRNASFACPWEIQAQQSMIRRMKSHFDYVTFDWIDRLGNKPTDWLASSVLNSFISPAWVTVQPPRLSHLLYLDLIG